MHLAGALSGLFTSPNSPRLTMPESPEGRVVFAIAQVPFENENRDTMTVNVFGTLAPVLDDRGRRADAEDFPNSGLAWWMLRPGARSFAEPGRLVSAFVEPAEKFFPNNADSHYFQVDVQSVEPVKGDLAIEIINADTLRVKSASDLINLDAIATSEHPVSDVVLVRWKDRILGPFRASSTKSSEAQYEVSLALRAAESTVAVWSQQELLSIGAGYAEFTTVTVSLEQLPPARARRQRHLTFELVTGAGAEALKMRPHEVIELSRDVDVIRRVAKDLLSRKEKQQLSQLLDRLRLRLDSGEPQLASAAAIVDKLSGQLARDEALARELAAALVESGTLEGALDRYLHERSERYIAENSARLRSDIAAQVTEIEGTLRELREQQDAMSGHLESHRREALQELNSELTHLRESVELRIREDREQIERERVELARQRDMVAAHLEAASSRFESSRNDVLRDFLTLWPLFRRMLGEPAELQSTPRELRRDAISGGAVSAEPRAETIAPLMFPEFVVQPRDGAPSLEEHELLARFSTHLRAQGFAYREIDVVSFHLSVKCGDLTILGGVSGTGKSTLPRLYAEAIAGSEQEATREDVPGRYLHVAVRPSWLDFQDLLGHVNGLERRFIPAESGLYRHMVLAQEEAVLHGSVSGVYLTCLDEMNLSHVEHYFGGFLQAFERGDGLRLVRVFDESAVRDDDPFRRWHTLSIPMSVRFVGTVNYDETTRPLSYRLLDRANVIELQPEGTLAFAMAPNDRQRIRVEGAAVTQRMLTRWTRDEPLERGLGEVLDRMSPLLTALRCPITPRRYRAISRFVASANGLCSAIEAFDLQVCQRVLPQVRNVLGPEALEALEALRELIESDGRMTESARVVRGVLSRETGSLV